VTIGVFGGTFDPPHLGHLAAAQEAIEACGLERVLFVPSERNPLKLDNQISPTHHRLAMTELAIADDPRYSSPAPTSAAMGHPSRSICSNGSASRSILPPISPSSAAWTSCTSSIAGASPSGCFASRG